MPLVLAAIAGDHPTSCTIEFDEPMSQDPVSGGWTGQLSVFAPPFLFTDFVWLDATHLKVSVATTAAPVRVFYTAVAGNVAALCGTPLPDQTLFPK